MNKDQAKGRIKEAQGAAKEINGDVMKANLKIIRPDGPLRARSPYDRRHGIHMPIRDTDRNQTDSPVNGRLPTLISARTFLGDEVYNRKEDRLGKLTEFMLDLNSGRVCYAVMSCGGFLGVGEKLFAIPWRALTLDAENACFVLDIAEERLRNSPGFDKRHWPDMGDAAWVKDIDTFYGIPPETCAGRGISII